MNTLLPPSPPLIYLILTLSVCVTHYYFILSLLPFCQQEGRDTALIRASYNGQTEAIKLLLAVPGIDVNYYVDYSYVSLYLPT